MDISLATDTFADAISRLDEALDHVALEAEVIKRLRRPKLVVEVAIPVRMDNGSLEIFTGYRVRHDDTRGPGKGGIRFHPNVTVSDVKALAFWMTLKTALMGLPFGGAKGGVIVDPRKLSRLEVERLSRGYMARISKFVGPETDVPAPDVFTNQMIMGWMMDEYSRMKGRRTPAVITGKPLHLGGSKGREDATGRGGFYCIQELMSRTGRDPSQTRVAVQGFGNVGYHVARLLHSENYKVVAVSDWEGGLYRRDGLDIPAVAEASGHGSTLAALYRSEPVCGLADCPNKACTGDTCTCEEECVHLISNENLLELDVDILVPAAMENQITAENAGRIRAPFIVELANGPITTEGDSILKRDGKFVVPDVLANAGGVIVSYFEWAQNRSGLYWDEEEIHGRLGKTIRREFDEVYRLAQDRGISMRTAAYVQALTRLGGALQSQGTSEYFRGDA